MRTKRVVKLGQVSGTTIGGETLLLNTNPSGSPGFLVSHLVARVALGWSGGTPSGTLGATTVGAGRIDLSWQKTQQKMLNNVTFRALDLWAARQRRASVRAYDVLTDQAAAATTHKFDFIVPMRRGLSYEPRDYCVQLDEIGQLSIQSPDLSSVAGTGTGYTFSVTLLAVGYDGKAGEYKAGVHWRLDEVSGATGTTVEISLPGNPLHDFFEYTIDTSGSPISGETSPQLSLDNRPVQSWIGANAAELSWLGGELEDSDDYSAFVTASGYSNTLLASYLPPPAGCRITELPSPRLATLEFVSRLATATDARFIYETLYPSQSGAALAQRIPGVGSMSPGAIRASLVRPGIAEVEPSVAAILPAKMQLNG